MPHCTTHPRKGCWNVVLHLAQTHAHTDKRRGRGRGNNEAVENVWHAEISRALRTTSRSSNSSRGTSRAELRSMCNVPTPSRVSPTTIYPELPLLPLKQKDWAWLTNRRAYVEREKEWEREWATGRGANSCPSKRIRAESTEEDGREWMENKPMSGVERTRAQRQLEQDNKQ